MEPEGDVVEASPRALPRWVSAAATVGAVALVLIGIHLAMTASNAPVALAGPSPAAASTAPSHYQAAAASPADPSWSPTRFPSSTYPASHPASENTFGIVACPDAADLQTVSTGDRANAVQTLFANDSVLSVQFQQRTDRAWWANGASQVGPTTPVSIVSASTLARAGLDRLGVSTVRAVCGVRTADRTFVVVSRPPGGGPALVTDYLFVKRDGTLLLWLTAA